MKPPILLLLAFFLIPLRVPAAEKPGPLHSVEVPNFALLDYEGKYHELHRAGGRAVVLFFSGTGCPIVRQSISKVRALRKKFADQGVVFWMVNSYAEDDRQSVKKEAEQFKVGSLPVLMDEAQAVTLALGVERTAEVIAINASNGRVFYRGAIDDQLTEGATKPEAGTKFLENALTNFLAGTEFSPGRTPVKGCLITFPKVSEQEDGLVSYAKQVAPILLNKCVSCHSEGNIGPFAMSGYKKVKSKARMIEEVIIAKRMPPWHADPHYGSFASDRSLNATETQTLLRWIKEGAPRGNGDDPLEKATVAAVDWPLGKPDYLVKLPKPEEIPATGVLDYRHIKVPSTLPEDVWLGAIAIRPGNRKVVHHVIVRAKYTGAKDDGSGRGTGLVGWAPGYTAARFPEGTGKPLGKGAVFDIEMHYTTVGTPETDQTEIGFYVLPNKPKMALRTEGALNTEFSIPPGEADSQTFGLHSFKKDSLIFGLTPHMHLRGSWMKYEALYPDGKRETLLSVPRYDFNWQTEYRLAQPKRVPAGTWLLCTGGFDNSAQNPANPDPGKRVKWGDQSFDEMFIGFFNAASIPKDETLSLNSP